MVQSKKMEEIVEGVSLGEGQEQWKIEKNKEKPKSVFSLEQENNTDLNEDSNPEINGEDKNKQNVWTERPTKKKNEKSHERKKEEALKYHL